MRDPIEQLHRIQNAIIKITEYAKKGRRKFDTEEEIQLSAIYYLQTIREAASALPLEFRNLHPDIPWRSMINMRNKLIHHYDGIDLDIVWETATVGIPDLAVKIQAILEDNS